MLSLTQPIVETDIFCIAGLAPRHPVFLLDGLKGDQLVIKQETMATRSMLATNALVMNAIEPSAPSTPLSPAEISQVKMWLQTHRPTEPESAKLHQELNHYMSSPGWWSKMPVKQLVDLHHAVKNKKEMGDKKQLRLIADSLNAPGGLEKFGEILAADLFNGNGDRFGVNFNNISEDLGIRTDQGDSFHHFVNIGNLLMSKDDKKNATPVGLDAYDPGSCYKDWQEPLAQSEKNWIHPWAGRLLGPVEGAKRTQFAERCLDDINRVMGPRNRKIPFASKLRIPMKTGESIVRVVHGIDSGVAKIKNAISSHYRNKPKPVGLLDRAAVLGWALP